MKREFIGSELEKLKVEDKALLKEVENNLMIEFGKAFKEKDEKIEELETTKESLDNQLKETNEKVKKLSEVDAEKLNEEIKNLTDKYDKDTKELQNKLSKQKYDFKVQDLVRDINFSSESAKKTFIRDLEEKGLKLENDKILGFDDFVNSYKENDPKAFIEKKVEEKNDNSFVASTGSQHQGKSESEIAMSQMMDAMGISEE